MPVLLKTHQEKLEQELRRRFELLCYSLSWRDLTSAKEGAGKGRWTAPDNMCATTRSSLELRSAVDDFKSILSEVKKL